MRLEMKKTVTTFVLAGIMTAGFSCTAMAAPEGTQALDPSVEASLKTSEDHNQKLDELQREKEILDLESAVTKLKLTKEQAEADMRKLRGAPGPAAQASASVPLAAEVPPPQMPMGVPDMGGYFGMQPAQPAAKKQAPLSLLDRVYVTRIYGVGGVRNVTVILDNSVFTGTVGDEITEGLRIAKVTDNGAVFTYKGKSKSVNLTAQGVAVSKSHGKQVSADTEAESTPPTMGAGFGKMAQEITTGVNVPPPHPR
jgi:hypothetical protein